MGLFNWLMKGIGFESDETSDEVAMPEEMTAREKRKLLKKEKMAEKRASKEQKIQPEIKPGFDRFASSPEAFSDSNSPKINAEATSFGEGLSASSVGGFGSKTFVFFKPKSYEDVKSLVDFLRQGEPAIINLDGISDEEAQRILDFVSGAVCALSGTIQRISGNIFLVAPEGYDIKLSIK